MIPTKQVSVPSTHCCVLSGEAAHTNTNLWIDPTGTETYQSTEPEVSTLTITLPIEVVFT